MDHINLNIGGFIGAFLGAAICGGASFLLLVMKDDNRLIGLVLESVTFGVIAGGVIGTVIWAVLFPSKQEIDQRQSPSKNERPGD